MCPSIPLSVNSGTKAAIMIAAEKKIPWLTSVAAPAMISALPRSPLSERSL